MEADAVLLRARSGDVPANWTVLPLRRNIVRRSALRWTATGIVGLILFGVAASQMIPGNFTHGGAAIVISGFLLIILAIMGFGGASFGVYDFWRVVHADEYLLVMTPDDFVKAEPRKVTHVPMEHVEHVTLRGIKIPQPQGQYGDPGGPSMNVSVTRLIGLSGLDRKPKQAPSLAFVDSRTDRPVVVGTDNTFDELVAIEEVLAIHSDNKRRSRTG